MSRASATTGSTRSSGSDGRFAYRPAAAPGQRHLVHFGALDHTGQVWVAGHLVTSHVGGQMSFFVDISDALGQGDQHVLVVRAFDGAQDYEQPRGKQEWQAERHPSWYAWITGIWRSVWTEMVQRQRIERLDWSSDYTSRTVDGRVAE